MKFSTEKIASEFFEMGSEQRLSIILHLDEKPWSISAMAKQLDSTVTEVHRNFKRLQNNGLIYKDPEGTFRLTIRGQNICSQVPSIAFISENEKYFETHNFGKLPTKFRERIGDLYDQKHIKGIVRVLEKWRQIHNNAEEYICNVLTEVPYSKEIIDVVEEKLNQKIGIKSVFDENAIIPEERKTKFEKKNFNKFVKEELLQRRMIEDVSVIVLLNEQESCVMFPNQTGDPDMTEMFYSKDSQFHEWCRDYFEYCWKNSSSFQESKLKSD